MFLLKHLCILTLLTALTPFNVHAAVGKLVVLSGLKGMFYHPEFQAILIIIACLFAFVCICYALGYDGVEILFSMSWLPLLGLLLFTYLMLAVVILPFIG